MLSRNALDSVASLLRSSKTGQTRLSSLPKVTLRTSERCHVRPLNPFSLSRCMSSKNQQDGEKVRVYTGEMSGRVTRVKILSLTSSALGLAAQPVLYENATSLPTLIAMSSFVGFFTFVTPILLHIVIKRYVTDVTYDPKADVYTAGLMTFFGRRKEITIKPGEANIPDVDGMLTTVYVRGIPLFMDATKFDLEHYNRILGFDKPLDIKFNSLAMNKAASEGQSKDDNTSR